MCLSDNQTRETEPAGKRPLRYLILGAGGTGGPLGAYLAKTGKDVTLIARGAHLAALQQSGLLLETTFRGTERIPVKAASMEDYQEQPDIVFVCVKYYSLNEAVPFLRRIATPDTVIIPILNVYGTGRQLQKALPNCLVTDGCIYVSANLTGPGHLKMHGPIFRVVYGLPSHKTDDARLLQVTADLQESGITAEYSANIEKDALKKFSYVSTMATCGLYYHAQAKEMQAEGEVRQFFVQLIREIQALAEAMGIHYEEDLVEVNLRILDDLAPSASTSMQRDIYAGKPSEIDGLIYEVVRLGDHYGLALPGYRKAAERFREEGL